MIDYESDLYAWSLDQARALAERRVEDLDFMHLAEELESLGGSQRSALRSRIRILLMHLLKWEVQPDMRTRSWRSTINTQRDAIEDLINESPSFRNLIEPYIEEVREKAILLASDETGIRVDSFKEPASKYRVYETLFNTEVEL